MHTPAFPADGASCDRPPGRRDVLPAGTIVLGIESSCDETGLALCETRAAGQPPALLGHALHSQIDLHALYGGVVPELASRDHLRRLLPLLGELLRDTGRTRTELGGIAYTAGPGLAGALLTGTLFARAAAAALDLPVLGVHHMEGHLLSPMLEPDPPAFPFVCLLVSGGHTQIVRVEGLGHYTLMGDSIDDAAGEAFDKTAKRLGLPYPGGAALSRLAEAGDPAAVPLPRPMMNRPGFDFSFSGLKTAAITRHRAAQAAGADTPAFRADLAAGFEAAVIDVLAGKAFAALADSGLTRLVVAGGVSANARLRERFASDAAARGASVSYPRLAFCTDNGAMIALAGAWRLAAGERDEPGAPVRPRWPLERLSGLPQPSAA